MLGRRERALGRRAFSECVLLSAAALVTQTWTRRAKGFGQEGGFNPRLLGTSGTPPLDPERESGLSRWAWELVRRTSAPAQLITEHIAVDDPKLENEPFAVWAGSHAVKPLLGTERRALRRFLDLGGVLFVDDGDPGRGEFGQSARAELARVLPEVPIAVLPEQHVIYKSYYLVERPVGRVLGPTSMEAMVRGRQVQVLFSSHDLLGALAHGSGETFSLPMEGENEAEMRQRAIRLAVNIAMYVLCSDYKDDQVHAEELMRRRGRAHSR
ncbi:MAG TPA: DUF4159 domain-containing protein [Polyangiaceae bacterium]|nr:DUF4159 domain-containing protein [Polyangiaceae bacterium]